jgi:hypothetical protein
MPCFAGIGRTGPRAVFSAFSFWYVGCRVPLNLDHIEARMRQSRDWSYETPLDVAGLRKCLEERFAAIDFERAREDVAPFLKDSREHRLWSFGFFMELIPQTPTSQGRN